MKIKQLLLTAAAAAILATTGAAADPYDHHDRGPGDRYWRGGYHGYVGRDRVFFELRRNHFNRWDGEPYWFQGRYVIRSYDRGGRPVIVEMNPYTGTFIGVVRF